MTQVDRRGQEMSVPLRPNTSTVNLVALSAFVGIVLLISLFFVFSSDPLSPILFRILLLASFICLAPLFACIFYRCHARLILSGTGLCWRTWGDWRRSSWGDVQDYYDQPPRLGYDSDDLMIIDTNGGNIILNRRWPESGMVRQLVQECALQAETAEWGIQG